MKNNVFLNRIFSYEVLLALLCFVYVGMLLHYAIAMWETRQRYGIPYLALTLMIASFLTIRERGFFGAKGTVKTFLAWLFFALSLVGGLYFFFEYPSLVYERSGATNTLDVTIAVIYVYLTFHITIKRVGLTIPIVAMVFVAYGLFGHLLPGTFFSHSYLRWHRIADICAGEIGGIFGSLNQIGATWIAIFAFFAGFVQGFGGLNYVLKLSYLVVGKTKRHMPQVAVIASMGFGGMSGSAGANAIGTGAFTIPTMKRFGMPPAQAAAVEAVASSGGQIMPPILGAVAFVMCDYLNMFYYEILFASLFSAIIYFGSTQLSVYFLARKFIDPKSEAALPVEFKKKMTGKELSEGLPIAIGFAVLLYVFIVYKVDILLGGFFTTLAFLAARFIYEAIVAHGKISFIGSFIKGVYQGVLQGTKMMLDIAVMLAVLGIVVEILVTTGLSEKLSYMMVKTFGNNLWLFLFFTMVICILFGMAVTTVAAYILAVTLAAPALLKLGIDPLVTHFTVFYWAMLSGITPPVAGVAVITAGIAEAPFMKTCWESMKLGLPKFILPLIFVTQPLILSLSLNGSIPFLISSIGFVVLTAGIQSGWGFWQQAILIVLSFGVLFLKGYELWICVVLTVAIFLFFWKKYNPRLDRLTMSQVSSLQE